MATATPLPAAARAPAPHLHQPLEVSRHLYAALERLHSQLQQGLDSVTIEAMQQADAALRLARGETH